MTLLEAGAGDLAALATRHAGRHDPGHFVDGELRPDTAARTAPLRHPGTGDETGRMLVGSDVDVDIAMASARKAFEGGEWAGLARCERGRVLTQFADLVLTHAEELALLETLDMGKPVRDAYSADVPKSARMIRWYAEAIDKQYDEVAPTSADVHAFVRRAPLGVVGCITPWNFPLYQASYKLGPVLAAGNSLVIKPSELSPRSTLRVAELAVKAGLPPGVLNVVTGDGQSTGAALAGHPDLDCIAFTGGSATARAVSSRAASSLAKVSIESGGKSAHVVLPDVTDLNAVAAAVVDGFCYNQGQVCSAGSRLIVPHELADELVARVVARAAASFRPGDPFDPATTLGPLVSATQLERVRGFVQRALGQGAVLVLADDPELHPDTAGHWFTPVVLDHVSPDSEVAREEVFGPVLAVLRYGSDQDPVAIANGTAYALGAAVWSPHIDRAMQTASRLRAGQVWVNNYDGSDLTVPWGGFKLSGHGRDKSLEALHEFTGSVATWVSLGNAPG